MLRWQPSVSNISVSIMLYLWRFQTENQISGYLTPVDEVLTECTASTARYSTRKYTYVIVSGYLYV